MQVGQNGKCRKPTKDSTITVPSPTNSSARLPLIDGKTLIKNVKAWANKLQDHHWGAGRKWYQHANQLCQILATETETPLRNVCGVLASLSPQVSWEVNIRSCEAIVRDGQIDKGYTGYRINVDKALQCLVDDPENVLGGFKVLAFYRNILDPLRSVDVTVDTHIGRIVFDTMRLDTKQQNFLFSKNGNAMIQQAIQKEANKRKVRPHVLQASLWVCARELAQAKADKDQLPLYVK